MQRAESREQRAESREQRAENREQRTENREQRAERSTYHVSSELKEGSEKSMTWHGAPVRSRRASWM